MSYNKDEKAVEEAATVQKIRITLTGTNVSDLENVCSQLITRAANSDAQKVKGPVRIPTKTLKITTRKTPNGEGSKTWDTYEMRIHKRVIDIWSPPALVKQVTSITLTSGIDIEITVAV